MIRIMLLVSTAPREVLELAIEVPEGATIGQALELSGWQERLSGMSATGVCTGIWGRRAALETTLRDGDRVEIYRGLRVDPKVARRERFVGQGTRASGLFAQRRPNSKAGY